MKILHRHQLTLWLTTLLALYLVPFCWLSGSSRWLISAAALIFPIIGGLVTAPTAGMACTIIYIAKYFMGSIPITFGIPTLCATLSWSVSSNRTTPLSNFIDLGVHVMLPLCCIATFIVHPVGQNAYAYSWYWLIPPAVYVIRIVFQNSSPFLLALQSTFIAHAVGSILWLYTVPMTAAQWNMLIPLVAAERFIMAIISTTAYAIIAYGTRIITQSSKKRFKTFSP